MMLRGGVLSAVLIGSSNAAAIRPLCFSSLPLRWMQRYSCGEGSYGSVYIVLLLRYCS